MSADPVVPVRENSPRHIRLTSHRGGFGALPLQWGATTAAERGPIGPITPQQRQVRIAGSLVAGAYEKAINSESAYEILKARTEATQAETAKVAEASGGFMGGLSDVLFGSKGPRGGARDGLMQQVLKSEARNLARQVLRGALASILGGKKR